MRLHVLSDSILLKKDVVYYKVIVTVVDGSWCLVGVGQSEGSSSGLARALSIAGAFTVYGARTLDLKKTQQQLSDQCTRFPTLTLRQYRFSAFTNYKFPFTLIVTHFSTVIPRLCLVLCSLWRFGEGQSADSVGHHSTHWVLSHFAITPYVPIRNTISTTRLSLSLSLTSPFWLLSPFFLGLWPSPLILSSLDSARLSSRPR